MPHRLEGEALRAAMLESSFEKKSPNKPEIRALLLRQCQTLSFCDMNPVSNNLGLSAENMNGDAVNTFDRKMSCIAAASVSDPAIAEHMKMK
jgi:hypothetical protein